MHHVFRSNPLETPRCGSRRHLAEPQVPAVRTGYLLCRSCLESVENALVDLPDWYAERVRCARDQGRPLHSDVVGAVSDVVASFSSWCAVVVSQRGVAAPEPPTVMLLAGFLAVHLQWLTARRTAPEFADDLLFLEQTVARTVRMETPPPVSPPVPLGPCPWPGCREQLYATAGESSVDQRIACVSGHRWPPDQWLTPSRESADGDNRGDNRGEDQGLAGGGNLEVA